MTNKYPLKKYKIVHGYKEELFSMFDDEGKLVGEATNGRELGRDAWEKFGAEEVEYAYDLRLDENLPLKPRYEKYGKV